jgi:hypothetical protein
MLEYQILIQKGIMISDNAYFARIIDAGATGMRLFLSGIPPLPVGGELSLQCVPARRRKDGKEWRPIIIYCKIIWRDLRNYSYGLAFY